MNNRILEIVKNTELLNVDDIEILEKEISKYPFIQSFRAVQLLATHRFQDQNYTGKLSQTAAFTTDKKILYQLIHQKEIKKEKVAISEEVKNKTITEEISPVSKVEKLNETSKSKYQEIEIEQVDFPKQVFIDGELNRILFEGEENFLNEETEVIDLEATQESGEIVTFSKDGSSGEFKSEKIEILSIPIDSEPLNRLAEENTESLPENLISIENSFQEIDEKNNFTKENSKENTDNNKNDLSDSTAKFTAETIINEDQIKSEEEIVESGSELSFHGETEFLPNIKIEIKKEVTPYLRPENKISKHEAEMQKLIAEVEAKMKKEPSKKTEIDDYSINNDLNFTGISHDESPEILAKNEDSPDISDKQISAEQPKPEWKPLDLSSKKSTFRNNEILKSDKSELPEEIEQNYSEESHSDVEDLANSKVFESTPENIVEEPKEISAVIEESNVPVFFNTWQNWLKLKPEPPVLKEDSKLKAIENFIEREPRISKLKDENSFVVKERGDNISHLMTETLANLYLDQKLYTKAQKAFELLIEKDPAKADRFREKIQNIKSLKNQK
ncbi:hypothetical protein [Halpernia frigidisoli]|uniref:Uncharacterized protein n=1 Tax=Halpernia frigidisoli TaxID=1125876 RepID=A0A1I3HT11_9FLAO|nr:hypothetical protein [Halpernia frigidisoli]SFI38908.1 hypothetical protein SAMN05443292_2380 [Halpernia frigidisoli]